MTFASGDFLRLRDLPDTVLGIQRVNDTHVTNSERIPATNLVVAFCHSQVARCRSRDGRKTAFSRCIELLR